MEQNIHDTTTHLFRHESGKMLSVLLRLFGLAQVEIAEDIVQEVLIRLWENRRHYQDITCLRSFVYTMIRNQSLNL